jgi:WD40 repeat protein
MKSLFLPFLLLLSTLVQSQTPRLVVPIGHASVVQSVAFSPDGNTVLTGSWDGTAKLWDLSGRELQTFSGAGWISAVAFSPDGKTVLTGSSDGKARLFDLAGRELQVFSYPTAVEGIHTVAFSPDGRKVVTGGEDGVARLWNLSGQELQTFSADSSAVLSVAFSPAGQQLLTGALSGQTILWDLSGKVIRTFSGSAALRAIYAVAFSPDGQQVLTGGADGMARLWDLSGQEIQTFPTQSFAVLAVAFSPDGQQLFMGTINGEAILWDRSGQVVKTFSGLSEVDEINAVTFSPDGTRILTGHRVEMAKLWDLSGSVLQTFVGHTNQVLAASFSPDGTKILTSGSGRSTPAAIMWDLATMAITPFHGHQDMVISAVFSPAGDQVLTSSVDGTAIRWNLSGKALQTFDDYVTSAAFSPDGQQILTGTQDFTANLWDLSGALLQVFSGHEGTVSSVAFSPDGQNVLTSSMDETARLWDLAGKTLTTYSGVRGNSPYERAAFFSPTGNEVLTSMIPVTDLELMLWNLAGVAQQVFSGHSGLFYGDFSPDGQQLLTSNLDGTASLWDLGGKELHTFGGPTKVVSAATFAPNGKQILTVNRDNTMTIWDIQSGQELVSLILLDSTDWVVTTPSGLFDASPGAMKQMYYMVGLELVELEQLKERYYEPGLLQKTLGFNEGTVRDVSALREVALYPEIRANIAETTLNIALTVRSGGLGQLSLFLNGKEMAADINPDRKTTLSVDLRDYNKFYLPGTNTLALRVYNEANWLKSQAYELAYTPPAAGKGTGSNTLQTLGNAKPELYAIVVGTSDYSGRELDLTFPDLDAAAMASALAAAGSRLFEDRIHFKVLTTTGKTASEVPSKANIAAAFTAFAAEAKPTDILIVYFSGHGLTYGGAEKSQFYYLTKDISSADLKDEEVRNNYTVSSEDLTRWLTAIPASKQVMILDACNSGKVVESLATVGGRSLSSSQIRAFDRMKDRTGMFILTGSAADKVSFEASQYGQGLLTFSLLQGMSGLALTPDKRVDVMTLFQYARDEVPVLAKGIRQVQVPVLAFPAGGGSFDIGIVDAGVKIPLAQVKPVFIRNNFQDEDNFDDGLGLTQTLAAYFQEITARGAQADVIYVDVSAYEGAYSIKGRYTVTGDVVVVRGRLFKGKTALGDFQLTGKKDALPALVEAIVDKVSEML